jgi:hypothetical protein
VRPSGTADLNTEITEFTEKKDKRIAEENTAMLAGGT